MIAIGCDHAGCEMKRIIIETLSEKGWDFCDLGCNGEACDYPFIAEKVCTEIISGRCDMGILICGTGIGMSMAANKINGIRAAVCGDSFSAKYTRLHNNANVICLGARTIGCGLAVELADIFLNTNFEGGRHQRRIDMITNLEKKG